MIPSDVKAVADYTRSEFPEFPDEHITRDGTPYKVILLDKYTNYRGPAQHHDLLSGVGDRSEVVALKRSTHIARLNEQRMARLVRAEQHFRQKAELFNLWSPLGGGILIGALLVWIF